MSFAWFDAFRPSRRVAQNNIHYEKAALLFNLGALASQQGLQSDRTSGDGLTAACKLFQVRVQGVEAGKGGGRTGFFGGGHACAGGREGELAVLVQHLPVARPGGNAVVRRGWLSASIVGAMEGGVCKCANGLACESNALSKGFLSLGRTLGGYAHLTPPPAAGRRPSSR